MNLKNSRAEEMINTESPNTTQFNQTATQPNSQWSSPQSSNKNFLNNLQTIYNDSPSTEGNTFAYNLTSQSSNSVQPNSSNYFTNSNLMNLTTNQELSTPTNIQLIDQSKAFANPQISSHYYNHSSLHNQAPILNNNVYDFSNELSNGPKSYLDHGIHQHVLSTTNNFHHYNISLHPNSNNLQNEPINLHHHLQLENNLLEQNQNNLLNSAPSSSIKKRKKDQLLNSSTSKVSKNLAVQKNAIKKEPNQSKEDKTTGLTNCSLNRSLNQPITEGYANYEFLNNENNLDPNSSYSAAFLESIFQSIKFYPFQQNSWYTIYDENFNKLSRPQFEVYADKGFNFSNIDDAFVCQKKNHFQLTVHIHPIKLDQSNSAKLTKFNSNNFNKQIFIKLKTVDGAYEFKKVDNFVLAFYGVKMESANQKIKIEQSQSDRSKKPFEVINVNFLGDQICKNTIGRLHFAETTAGNMRKKGKPNPDQKFFYLVAALCAVVDDKHYTIVSHASERIIVRASNPGQFEMSDSESCWQRSQFATESIYHNGKVGINLDDPDEALVVCGNLKLTGVLVQPSDQRIKENINPINTNSSLVNISKLNLYSFNYNSSYSQNFLKGVNRNDVGVLAQEVIKILPDAVKNSGSFKLNDKELLDDFLVVNKDRLMFEGLGAIQELNSKYLELKKKIDKLESLELNNHERKFSHLNFRSTYLFILIALLL